MCGRQAIQGRQKEIVNWAKVIQAHARQAKRKDATKLNMES